MLIYPSVLLTFFCFPSVYEKTCTWHLIEWKRTRVVGGKWEGVHDPRGWEGPSQGSRAYAHVLQPLCCKHFSSRGQQDARTCIDLRACFELPHHHHHHPLHTNALGRTWISTQSKQVCLCFILFYFSIWCFCIFILQHFLLLPLFLVDSFWLTPPSFFNFCLLHLT